MNNIFYFAFVGIIVVVSLYIILKILIKKFNPEESKVKLYAADTFKLIKEKYKKDDIFFIRDLIKQMPDIHILKEKDYYQYILYIY